MTAQPIARTPHGATDPRLKPGDRSAALRAGEIAIVIPDDLSATRLDLLPGDSLVFSQSGSVAGFIRPAHDRAARLKYALALEESEPWYRPLEDEAGLRDRCFLPTEFAPRSVAWTPALLERPPARQRPFPAALEWDDERAVDGVVRCIMVRAGRELDDARAVAMLIEMRHRAGIAFQSRLLQNHPDQRIIAYIDVPQWWWDWACAEAEKAASATPEPRSTRRRKSPSDRVRGGGMRQDVEPARTQLVGAA